MAKETDQKLQQAYMQLQMIGQQLQELDTQANAINTQTAELQKLKEGIGELAGVKAGAKTFSQVGPGVFVKSQIADTSEILVNVGAGIFIGKLVPAAQDTINKQIELISTHLGKITANMQMLNQQAMILQERAKGLVG